MVQTSDHGATDSTGPPGDQIAASRRLDLVEEAHLGRLIARIAEPGRSPLERLTFSRPAPAAPDAEPTNPTTTNNS
jgi:hypothetical protein